MSAEALENLKAFWEGLGRERLAGLDEAYAPEAYFRDPFNEVRGIGELERIFGHMYETLEEPRFAITETILEGDRAVLIWDFDFRIKAWQPGVTRRIHGLSVGRFGPDGRVIAMWLVEDGIPTVYGPRALSLLAWLLAGRRKRTGLFISLSSDSARHSATSLS